MALGNGTGADAAAQAALADDPDLLRALVGHAVREGVGTEMAAHRGAASQARTESRTGERAGHGGGVLEGPC